jgi:hypothetical protein
VILSPTGLLLSAGALVAQVSGSLGIQTTAQEPPPPDNGGYLVAAYVVAGCIYLAYAVSLLLRGRRESGQR